MKKVHPSIKKPQNVAVFRLSAIGDVVMCSALVLKLKELYPEANIYWITTKMTCKVFTKIDGVEWIVIKKPKKIKDWLDLRSIFKKYHFDLTICCQANARVNLIYPLIQSSWKLGFDRKRGHAFHHFFVDETISYKEEHLQDGFLHFAEHLGANSSDFLGWPINVYENDCSNLLKELEINGSYLVINPMASKQERSWNVSNHVTLIKKIHQYYPKVQIVLSGGSGNKEVEMSNEIVRKGGFTQVKNLTGKTNIADVFKLLKKAKLLIAPDTGPVHMARCLNIPVIGLYAVARVELTGPYQAMNFCVNKYGEAVKKFLGKSHDKISWHTRVHHPDAMSVIKVDDVFEKVTEIL